MEKDISITISDNKAIISNVSDSTTIGANVNVLINVLLDIKGNNECRKE